MAFTDIPVVNIPDAPFTAKIADAISPFEIYVTPFVQEGWFLYLRYHWWLSIIQNGKIIVWKVWKSVRMTGVYSTFSLNLDISPN